MRIAERRCVVLLAVILTVLAVGMLVRPLPQVFFGDPGLGWHLKLGEMVHDYGGLPSYDPFTAERNAPQRWIYGQWLSDLLFHTALSLGGFSLLYLVCVLLCLYSVALASAWRAASPLALLLVVPTVALAASIQWLCRPILFSFLFFAFVLLLLQKERSAKNAAFLGTGLFALWSNLHPAFVLGFVPMLMKLLGERAPVGQRRETLSLLLGALLGSILNPQGLRLYEAVFSLGRSSYFQTLNREWLPPTLGESGFYPFFLLLGALLLLLIRRRGALGDYRVLTAVLLALLSLKSRRFIPFFCLSCAAPLIEQLTDYLERFRTRLSICAPCRALERNALAGSTAFLLVVTSLITLSPVHQPLEEAAVFAAYPQSLVEQIERGGGDEGVEVLHPAELGGYLSYRFWPPPISLIDDRNEVFSPERYQRLDSFFYAQPGWKETLAAFNPRYILCLKSNPISEHLDSAGYVLRAEEGSSLGTYVLFERNAQKN